MAPQQILVTARRTRLNFRSILVSLAAVCVLGSIVVVSPANAAIGASTSIPSTKAPTSPIAGLHCASICAFALRRENVVVSWKPTSGVSYYLLDFYFNGVSAHFSEDVGPGYGTGIMTQDGHDYYEFNVKSSDFCVNETFKCGVGTRVSFEYSTSNTGPNSAMSNTVVVKGPGSPGSPGPIAGLSCKSICAFAVRSENVVVSWKPRSGVPEYLLEFYFNGVMAGFQEGVLSGNLMTQDGQAYYEFNVKSSDFCVNETFKCGVGTRVSFRYAIYVGTTEGPYSAMSNTVVVKGPGSPGSTTTVTTTTAPTSPIAGLHCASICAFALRGENVVVSWKPKSGVSSYDINFFFNGVSAGFLEELGPNILPAIMTQKGQDYAEFTFGTSHYCSNETFKCGVGTKVSFEYATEPITTPLPFSAMSNTVIIKGPGSPGSTTTVTTTTAPTSPLAGLRCTSICAFAVGGENVVASWKPTSGVVNYDLELYFNGVFARFQDEVGPGDYMTQKGQAYYEFNISGQCVNETFKCGVGTRVSFEYATYVGTTEGPYSAMSNTVVVK